MPDFPNVYLRILAQIQGVKGSLQSIRREADALSTGFKGLQKSASIAAGVLLRDMVQGAVRSATEIFELTGRLDTLRAGFDAMIREVGATNVNIESLREVTRNTVSDIDLLTAANQALALNLPADELNDLFAAAMDVGHAMGRTTLQAVQDLTTGIGRQSRFILDNLGIIVHAEQAQAAYATSIGKTSAQLTDAERKTAFQTAAIESLREKARVLEGTTSEAQIAQEQWNAKIDNAKTSVAGALGPLGQFSGLFADLSPTIGLMAATTLPHLITSIGGVTGVIHGLNVAVKALMGPIGWVIAAVGVFAAAVSTNFGGVRDTITSMGRDFRVELLGQMKAVKEAYREQLAAIDEMVFTVQDKYTALENVLDASYGNQLSSAQQAWLDLIAVNASGWDGVVAQYEAYYGKQLSELNRFYNGKLDAEREHLDAIRGLRSQEVNALELQFLKEKQAIEESDTSYANKKLFIERLEKQLNEERGKLNDTYRVQELEAEQRFSDAEASIEAERADAIMKVEDKKASDIAAIRAEEKTLEEQHAKDLATLETQKQEELLSITETANQQRIEAEKQFNADKLALRAKMYDNMKKLASGQGFAGPAGSIEEEGAPSVIPVIPGASGVSQTVDRPTLFLAGEAGAEDVNISPRRGSGGYMMRTPTRVQQVFNGPLVYVAGSVDEGVAEMVTVQIQEVLKSVTVEASSSQAPSEQKRIRSGTTIRRGAASTPSLSGGRVGSTRFPI